jgi:hypothetical protein
MNGLAVTTTDFGFTLNIHWRLWLEKVVGLFNFGGRKELTEEEALRICEEGEREYREGRTETFRTFIRREYPQYAHYFNQKS